MQKQLIYFLKHSRVVHLNHYAQCRFKATELKNLKGGKPICTDTLSPFREPMPAVELSKMQIIKFKKNHLPDIISLWNKAVEKQNKYDGTAINTLNDKDLLEFLSSSSYHPPSALVAKVDSQVVGFAYGYADPDPPWRIDTLKAAPGRLAGFAVHPTYWDRGIGRALLLNVESALKDAGHSVIDFCHDVALDTRPYHFLIACGYRPQFHGVKIRQDITQFELEDRILHRQKELEQEGFVFRWLEESDHRHMLEFWAQHFPFWYPSDQVNVEKDVQTWSPGKILLATISDQIVGFIGPFHVKESGGWGSFGSPGVDPYFRHRGVGTVLMHLGMDYLKSQGAARTGYDSMANNPAVRMYVQTGAQIMAPIESNWWRKELDEKGRRDRKHRIFSWENPLHAPKKQKNRRLMIKAISRAFTVFESTINGGLSFVGQTMRPHTFP